MTWLPRNPDPPVTTTVLIALHILCFRIWKVLNERRARTPGRRSRRENPLEEMGSLPERTAMGYRPRGLQRRRKRLGLLQSRPGAIARVPLGRRRARWNFRRSATPLLRAGAVERQRSHHQRAAVRPDQQRSQPRRGRQGVLLLPRLDAHALVHEVPVQVSARGVSLRSD